jgi:hypothetical protein
MDGWAYPTIGCEPWVAASGGIIVVEAAVRRNASRLEEIRGNALALVSRSWESPAGNNFRRYLTERCWELARTVDLLEAAAEQLHECGRLVRDAEVLQRQAGL